MKKVVLIGGGVGSSIFTRALRSLPIELSTIVSTFDDGGSTGAIRRDYGGIALGDFRQCVLASLDLGEEIMQTINHRFTKGSLFSWNVGNLLIKAFLDQYPQERQGIRHLHSLLSMKNQIIPVSYTFAKLRAELTNGYTLADEDEIANYLNFSRAAIRSLYLQPSAKLNPDAQRAMLSADYIIFAPGNFFTSVLPHTLVDGFGNAWKKSQARKIWFVNLLAHKGQDSFYTLANYFKWFQNRLGRKPFHEIVINKKISRNILRLVEHRFQEIRVTPGDLRLIRQQKIVVSRVDLVLPQIRKQQAADPVLRAPLRHDVVKIRKFFRNLLKNDK